MANALKHDGIGYSITVSTSNGSYFATWTCAKCKVTGGPTGDYHSSEAAVACPRSLIFRASGGPARRRVQARPPAYDAVPLIAPSVPPRLTRPDTFARRGPG